MNRKHALPAFPPGHPAAWSAGILMGLAALGLHFLALRPGFAAAWSARANPILTGTLGRLSGLFPFSLAEVLVAAGLFLLLAFWPAFLLAGERRTGLLKGAAAFLVFLTGLMGLLFVLNEDIYFKKPSFAETYDLAEGDYTNGQLEAACRYLAGEINRTAPLQHRDPDGIMAPGANLEDRIRGAVSDLGTWYPDFRGYMPRPKGVLCSFVLSAMDFTGIYSIFTVEANYNREMPGYNLPFTMAHELSHLKGIMSEKEANYIGYLACIRSDQADLRYSGAMLGWIYCGNELYKRDREAWKAISGTICPEAALDLAFNSDFWKAREGKVSETADRINDTYLKAEGLQTGTASYDLVTDLIVAYETGGKLLLQ